MSRFIVLLCAYNPNNYVGHRVHTLEAQDVDAAKIEARVFMDKHWVHTNWEFRIIELAGHDSGPRLWDTRDPPKRAFENQYTIDNYWNT